MRFIGNHPIPEHVNPPEDTTASEERRVDHPQDSEQGGEQLENVRTVSQRRRRATKQGDRQAA